VVKPPSVCNTLLINISEYDIYSKSEKFTDTPDKWKESNFLKDLKVRKIFQFKATEDTLAAYANNSGSNKLCKDTFALRLINIDFNSPLNSIEKNNIKYSAIDADNYIDILFTETGDSSGFYKSDFLKTDSDYITGQYFIYSYSSMDNLNANVYKDRLFIAPRNRLGVIAVDNKPSFPSGTTVFDLLGNFNIIGVRVSIKEFSYGPNPVKTSLSNSMSFFNLMTGSKLKIYSIDGRIVFETTVTDENLSHEFIWNLKNNENKSVATGVYIFVAIDESGKTQKKKIAIIR